MNLYQTYFIRFVTGYSFTINNKWNTDDRDRDSEG